MTRPVNIRGNGVAIVTPFTEEGKIDWDSLETLLDHVLKGGVDFIVVLGTTGESPTLTKQEKDELFDFVERWVAGRVPLVAGIGGNNTLAVAEQIVGFKNKGYDAILSVTPYYNKPSQKGLIEHYTYLADRSPLPIILYNVPGRTGVNMQAETVKRLAEHKNIVGIKEASGNIEQVMELKRVLPEDFLIFSGDDILNLPYTMLGIDGYISVLSNVVPNAVSKIFRLVNEGKLNEASQIHYDLMPLVRLLFAEGNPAGVKCALSHMGIIKNVLRLPLVPVSDKLSDAIKQELVLLQEKGYIRK